MVGVIQARNATGPDRRYGGGCIIRGAKGPKTELLAWGHITIASRNYWLDLFTGKTWKEFLSAGAKVSGFRQRRWKTVQRMKPGDHLLCYLTGSRGGSEFWRLPQNLTQIENAFGRTTFSRAE